MIDIRQYRGHYYVVVHGDPQSKVKVFDGLGMEVTSIKEGFDVYPSNLEKYAEEEIDKLLSKEVI